MKNINKFKYIVFYTFGGQDEKFEIEESGFIGNETDALEFFKDEIYSKVDKVWLNDGFFSFDSWFKELYDCRVEKIDLAEEKEAREENKRQIKFTKGDKNERNN